MNRKLQAIALVAAMGSASSAKALIDANVFGGFATVAMGDVNNAIDKGDAANKSAGYSDVTSSKFGNGYYVGADLGISMLPFLKIGPRVEYVQAQASQGYTASGLKITNDITAALAPMMLGLSVDAGLPLTGLSLKGGVYGGYGIAKTLSTYKSGSAVIGTTASGGGFVTEVVGEARFGLPIIPFFSIGLDLAYRMANMAEMKDDVTGTVYKKPGSSDSLPYDYSGLDVGATLNFNF
jgi:opacity protein-like surface antigen